MVEPGRNTPADEAGKIANFGGTEGPSPLCATSSAIVPSSKPTSPSVPRAGMLAMVRNRRGVVAAVEPFSGTTGEIHLVHVAYKDTQWPPDEKLLWELEPGCELLEPNALPDSNASPMAADDFDALVRAARWTALSPYLDPDGEGPLRRDPIASPFHGSVRVEDYQLVPLIKALRMPRVSLLIADDVGLGKTIEAGLILTELLLRRRIQRILVITPASLRQQWREELWEKFALRFKVVDRQGTDRLRRRVGMDANPWRSFSRIVASYHYLRQPDVQEQFRAACRSPEGSPHLPWDLLIVDECHNLMPSPFGEDSELCRMLGQIAPAFEHRLFLSATPHNGHTRSFTGLLEMLDPVRFSRTSEMNEAMRRRVEDVVIRRLKRDINAAGTTPEAPRQPRFCTRNPPTPLHLPLDAREVELSDAFAAFREAIRDLITDGTKTRRQAGTFAVEVLGKRLLSCPAAFAESWRRAKQGLADPPVSEREVSAAERALRQETGDDRETQQREATATTVVGAWLRNFADDMQTEIDGIEHALEKLDFDIDATDTTTPIVAQVPIADTRLDTLVALIDHLLLEGKTFRDDERLIVFTEYKTTLDYLALRLRDRFPDERVLTLFGAGGADGMSDSDREYVKALFNDPASAVRILIATDAASEGLNLHRTARYLLHYDCPWNPSRLEQRNGRLDRYGQGRDVIVYYFVSDAVPDLLFLQHVIRKADAIREDLGSLNEIFDRATHRRLIQGHDPQAVTNELDASIDDVRGKTTIDADRAAAPASGATAEAARLDAMAQEIDLDPTALLDTLDTALAIGRQRPQLQPSEESGLYRVRTPDLPGWHDVIDDSVRRPSRNGGLGTMPKLAFSTDPFVESLGNLTVFRPRHDALLVHLAHPLVQRGLSLLARRRYPGERQVSRWTVRTGDVPVEYEALILFSVEEIAVNELRETFHRWVRTVAFPVRDGELGQALAHAPAIDSRVASGPINGTASETATATLDSTRRDLQRWLRGRRDQLTNSLRDQLQLDRQAARQREDARYRQREGELSALISQATVERLVREIDELQGKRRQGVLFNQDDELADIDRSIDAKREEIERRRSHYEEIRMQLRQERSRILDQLIPKRFELAGEAQVFPVAIEVRLPVEQA